MIPCNKCGARTYVKECFTAKGTVPYVARWRECPSCKYIFWTGEVEIEGAPRTQRANNRKARTLPPASVVETVRKIKEARRPVDLLSTWRKPDD